MAAEHDDQLPMPALMREARNAYTWAIRRALDDEGLADMPRSGARVIGRLGYGFTSVADATDSRGAPSAAAQRLVAALIEHGYVEQTPDRALALTERGRLAAQAMRGAIERTDAALVDAIGAAGLASLRHGLTVLVELAYGEELPPAPPGV